MLSNKWTFSLKILVVMLALAFVGHTAMAAEFAVTLSVGPNVDISSPDNIQAAYGAAIGINIATGSVVQAVTDSPTFTGTAAAHTTAIAATTLELDDFQVIAYNSFGGTVDPPPSPLSALTAVTPQVDGKSFTMQLAQIGAPDANQPLNATHITRVLIYIPKHAFEVADPRANLDAGVRTVDG